MKRIFAVAKHNILLNLLCTYMDFNPLCKEAIIPLNVDINIYGALSKEIPITAGYFGANTKEVPVTAGYFNAETEETPITAGYFYAISQEVFGI